MASNHEKKRINKASIDGASKCIQTGDTFSVAEVNCKLSLQEVIDGIESGKLALYIYKDGYQKLKVIVSENANGNKYLKIENDC